MQKIEEIYKQNFAIVNKYLFCLTNNSEIAEELTQETFYRAVKNISSFKEDCKISVWLCQIAKNLWYKELAKIKKTEKIDDTILKIQSNENIEENAIYNNEKIELYKRMQLLNEKSREVIYLRVTGELSFKEIGEILGQTENWARVTFYRAKQRIKEVKLYEKK